MKKRALFQRHNILYKTWCIQKELRYKCHYCGLSAPTLDHIPSLANVDYILSASLDDEADFIRVPSCKECNSLAADKLHLTLHDRFIDLKLMLLEKYEKKFLMPYWDEEELEEMDDTMRHYIQAALEFRDFLKNRIVYGFKSLTEAKYVLNTHLLDY